ncbi:hypothetical protein Hanom_Chr10g00902431 [Helianthus anomalus]
MSHKIKNCPTSKMTAQIDLIRQNLSPQHHHMIYVFKNLHSNHHSYKITNAKLFISSFGRYVANSKETKRESFLLDPERKL